MAAYDFVLPVNTRWYELPLLQQGSASATSLESVKHVIAPQPQRVTVAIPVCRVKAVGR